MNNWIQAVRQLNLKAVADAAAEAGFRGSCLLNEVCLQTTHASRVEP